MRNKAQGVLPIGGHARPARRAPRVGVADAMGELFEQHGRAAGVAARLIGLGVGQRLDDIAADHQHAEAEPLAQFDDIALLPALGRAEGEIDRIAHRLPVDALKQQLQREGRLEFDDHRRFAAAHRHHVAVLHLALDGIALRFQKTLHRQVEIGFGHGTPERAGCPLIADALIRRGPSGVSGCRFPSRRARATKMSDN